MGNYARWSEIYELNKDIIKSPSEIFPSQVLKLPEGSYDMTNRITAKELREKGYPIPVTIPDCAHTLINSILQRSSGKVEIDPETGIFTIPMKVLFTAPFEWVTINAVINKSNVRD